MFCTLTFPYLDSSFCINVNEMICIFSLLSLLLNIQRQQHVWIISELFFVRKCDINHDTYTYFSKSKVPGYVDFSPRLHGTLTQLCFELCFLFLPCECPPVNIIKYIARFLIDLLFSWKIYVRAAPFFLILMCNYLNNLGHFIIFTVCWLRWLWFLEQLSPIILFAIYWLSSLCILFPFAHASTWVRCNYLHKEQK